MCVCVCERCVCVCEVRVCVCVCVVCNGSRGKHHVKSWPAVQHRGSSKAPLHQLHQDGISTALKTPRDAQQIAAGLACHAGVRWSRTGSQRETYAFDRQAMTLFLKHASSNRFPPGHAREHVAARAWALGERCVCRHNGACHATRPCGQMSNTSTPRPKPGSGACQATGSTPYLSCT